MIVAALLGIVGCRSVAGASSSAVSPIVAAPPAHRSLERVHGAVPANPPGVIQGGRDHVLGTADGEVPSGVTVFDSEYPAVTKLDPALLGALRAATSDAAADGVELFVNSGWRSARYQEQLFERAVSTYGSVEKATQWVARPGTSVHEAGGAVDIGPGDAAAWLSDHGAVYGLCQIYLNEPWHFELRPGAVDHGCPPMYADPTHDPRVQH